MGEEAFGREYQEIENQALTCPYSPSILSNMNSTTYGPQFTASKAAAFNEARNQARALFDTQFIHKAIYA